MLKLKDEPKENYGTLDVDNNSSDGMEEVVIKEMDKVDLPYPKSIWFIVANEFCERYLNN